MKEKTFRANATDINKTPRIVRYVFILQFQSDSSYKGEIIGAITTYRTLSENLELEVKSIRIVDLRKNNISYLRFDQIESFLNEWRENYFNPGWEIPEKFKVDNNHI